MTAAEADRSDEAAAACAAPTDSAVDAADSITAARARSAGMGGGTIPSAAGSPRELGVGAAAPSSCNILQKKTCRREMEDGEGINSYSLIAT